MEELAERIRLLVSENNKIVSQLEAALRESRSNDMEVELLDGTNTEVNHDLDGLTAFKLRVLKISRKVLL